MVVKQGIYFVMPRDRQRRSDICYYDFSSGATRKVVTVEDGSFIAVSPDELTILYSHWERSGSDLMLVENFR